MIARTVGFAVALALGSASFAAAEVKNIDRTLPLTASGTLALDVHNGTIQIRTWDKPQVEIHVRIDWPGLSASSERFPKVDIVDSGDRVTVRWINNRDPYSWTFWSLLDAPWGPADVRYEITAPKTARLAIHNHNAETDIRDFAGPLELLTHNGRARVDFASFTHDTRVQMHNGTFEAAMPASSRFNVDARGHHMSVNSDFTSSAGGPDLRILSHNGSVRLHSKG